MNKHLIDMKRTVILSLLLFGSLCGHAQDSFQEYVLEQRKAFAEYSQQEQENFKRYRDSLNRAFASFLEKEWQAYPLAKPKPPIDRPLPAPPVYDPVAPQPEPQNMPVITPRPAPVPPADDTPPDTPPDTLAPPPRPEEDGYPVKTGFFGTPLSLKAIALPPAHLAGVSEKDAADYWRTLSAMPYLDIASEAMRIKTALQLNDWGLYRLLNRLFEVYLPSGTRNEQTVFVVFMLNELGYRAQTGRNKNELLPLIAFSNDIYNTACFAFGQSGGTYAVIDAGHKDLSSVQSFLIDYPEAATKKNMNLAMLAAPRLAVLEKSKTLKVRDEVFTMKYNGNIVDFYATCPLTNCNVYVESPVEEVMQRSIATQIKPHIRNKSQEEAVNWLLHYVQLAFDYQTDDEQFGYEKWNFAEETIASAYSDCDDRAILFAQLVRRLLGLPVVLIYYPRIHLATAVQFDNPATEGDYVMVDGKKYLICDPTFIHANLGMSMPDLRNVAVEIIKINKEQRQ